MRQRSTIAMFAVVLAGLSACSGGSSGGDETAPAANDVSSGPVDPAWAQVISDAKKEGTVTWYTNGSDDGNQALQKAFEAKYPGIKISFTRIPSGEVTTRIVREADTGVDAIDLATVGVPGLFADHGELFKELTPELVPALAAYPKSAAQFPQAENYTINQYGVGYNTDSVKKEDAPKTWDQIADPKWKGQIAYASPLASVTQGAFLEALQHYYGDSFLQTWGKMDWQLEDSGTPAAQAVVAGADKLALVVFPSSVVGLVANGAPIDYVIPTPVLTLSSFLGIAAKAPHPNAARLLADFILSPQGQSTYCKGSTGSSPLKNIDGCLPVPDETYEVKGLLTDSERAALLNLVGLKPSS